MVLTMTVYRDKISTNPGALGAEETRQSIPNLAVKLCCGDNTAGGALWKNSSAPGQKPDFTMHYISCFKLNDHIPKRIYSYL